MGKENLPRFNDPDAQYEMHGFDDGYRGIGLPGSTWQEGNMFDDRSFVPNCNMMDGEFHDPVWSEGPSDKLKVFSNEQEPVLGELFLSDAVRRLQAVEQLTLPPQYTTIPNTGAFSRFEHVWGSVLFTQHLTTEHGISGREATIFKVRTLLSDLAHTFGSHLGDWIFQGIGNGENHHDMELASYLKAVGINEVLQKHDITPEEVIFPEVNDWIEAPQPDLCVDRVDYGLREMNRWNDTIKWQNFTSKDFVITPDGDLAMKDQRRARIFSEGFLLLSQEHWSEPTHRFLLDMLMIRTKLFYAEGGAPRAWVFDEGEKVLALEDIHPRDLMYVTDPAQMNAYARPNLGGHVLDAIMSSISRYRRQYVWPGRKQRIYGYMDQFVNDYDNVTRKGYETLDSKKFSSYLDEYPPTLPGGVAILSAEEADTHQPTQSIDIAQPPFKTRQIDPLVQVAPEKFKRLSARDPSYEERLREHRRILAASHVARIVLADPSTYEIVKSIFDNVDQHWQERLETTRRMTPKELRSLVSVAARDIHGSYPFMTFLDY